MVLKRRLKMNGSIKLLSRIFKVLKTLKFIKRDQEKMLFSFFQLKFFDSSKKCYVILKIKMAIFTLFPGISAFSCFQILSAFGHSESVLESFFAFLTKN